MAKQYHFFGTIKKYTKALLDTFNDILISRDNDTYHKVPITFASKDPSYSLSTAETEALLTGNLNVFPRMSLGLETLDPLNTNRGLNRIDYTKNGNTFQYNSFGIELNYYVVAETRSMTELTEILEQVLPYFTPTLNLRVDELDGLQEPTSIKVELTAVEIALPTSQENNEARVCTAYIRLRLHGNLYPRITEPALIEHVKINMGSNDIIVSSLTTDTTTSKVPHFVPISPTTTLNNILASSININNEVVVQLTPKYNNIDESQIFTIIYNLIYSESPLPYNRVENDGKVYIAPNNRVVVSVQLVMKNGEYSNKMEISISKNEHSEVKANVLH